MSPLAGFHRLRNNVDVSRHSLKGKWPVHTSTIPSSNYAAFVVSELRCASLRARLLATEIQSAAVALNGGFIDADTALEWIRDAGGLGLVAVTSLSS